MGASPLAKGKIEGSAYIAAIETENYNFILDLFRHEPLNKKQAKRLCKNYKKISSYIKTWIIKHSINKNSKPLTNESKEERKSYKPAYINIKKAVNTKKDILTSHNDNNKIKGISSVSKVIKKIYGEYLSEQRESMLKNIKEMPLIEVNQKEKKRLSKGASMLELGIKKKYSEVVRTNSLDPEARNESNDLKAKIVYDKHEYANELPKFTPKEKKIDVKSRFLGNSRPMTAKTNKNKLLTPKDNATDRITNNVKKGNINEVVVFNGQFEEITKRIISQRKESKEYAMKEKDDEYSRTLKSNKEFLESKTYYVDEIRPYTCNRENNKHQVMDQQRLVILEQNLHYYKTHLPINSMFLSKVKPTMSTSKEIIRSQNTKRRTFTVSINGKARRIHVNIESAPNFKFFRKKSLHVYKLKKPHPNNSKVDVKSSKYKNEHKMIPWNERPMIAQHSKKTFMNEKITKDISLAQFINSQMDSSPLLKQVVNNS